MAKQPQKTVKELFSENIKSRVRDLISEHGGNVAETARKLSVPRSALMAVMVGNARPGTLALVERALRQ